MKAGIYARVSTYDQHTLEMQIAANLTELSFPMKFNFRVKLSEFYMLL
jgi:DNA invertase Pin-like site-specific DNA recombinase